MSGAVSFVLGLLGLGTAGGVSAVQGVSQKKKEAELAEMYGWDADTETQKNAQACGRRVETYCQLESQLPWRNMVFTQHLYEYSYDAQEMVPSSFGSKRHPV